MNPIKKMQAVLESDSGKSTSRKYSDNNGSPGKKSKQDQFLEYRKSIFSNFDFEKLSEKRTNVANWVDRYNKVVDTWSNPEFYDGTWKNRDAYNFAKSEIDSLLLDYDNIKDYADGFGLRNSQNFVNNLKNARDSFAVQSGWTDNDWTWYTKYQGNDSDTLFGFADGLDDGDEKTWLQNYANQVYSAELYDLDIDTARKEVAALEKERLAYLGSWSADTGSYRPGPVAGEYTSIGDVEDAISRKKQRIVLAERVQSDAANAEKYRAVMQRPDFKEKSVYDPNNTELGYRYINSDTATRLDMESQYGQYIKNFDYASFDALTDDEKAIYNYYMNTGDRKSAAEYLDYVKSGAAQRKGEAARKAFNKAPVFRYGYAAVTGLDQYRSGIEGFGRMIRGDDTASSPSWIQYGAEGVREDLSSTGIKLPDWLGGSYAGQTAFDSISTAANMAPSILTSSVLGLVNPALGGWAGNAMMGISAAGSGYQEMIDRGYSVDQARLYGTAVGTAEVIMERVLGGITNLGGKNSISSAMAKWINNVDNAIFNVVARTVGSGAMEGLEEGIQEIIGNWLMSEITHENFETRPADVLYSSLLGFISGGIFEGPSNVVDVSTTVGQGRRVLDAKGTDTLVELGNASADADLNRQAKRTGTKPSAYNVGKLYRQVSSDIHNQNVADISAGLVNNGMDKLSADKTADAVAYILEDGSEADIRLLATETDPIIGKTMRQVQMKGTPLYQRMQTYRSATGAGRNINQVAAQYGDMANAIKAAYEEGQDVEDFAHGVERVYTHGKEGGKQEVLDQVAPDMSPQQRMSIYMIGRDAAAQEKAAAAKRYSGETPVARVLNEDGSVGEAVRIEEVTSKEGGQWTYKTSDGQVLTDDQLSFSGDHAVLDTVKELDLDAKTASVMISGNNTISQPDAAVAQGIEDAYRYGSHGYSMERLLKDSEAAGILTEEMRQAAYDAGKNKPAKAKPSKAKPKTRDTKPGVYFDNGNGQVKAYDLKSTRQLKDTQKAGVQTAVVLQRLGIGTDFYFFESYVKDGKRVYRDEKGVERPAPNGWYDPTDGSIHIDLNAGNDGQGLTLYTMAHELTHFIEQWSQDKYKVLADFLIKNYEKGRSVDDLVHLKQEALSEGRNKPVSYEEAYSEVIADSMEAMLSDGNVLEKLAELKAKDEGLVRKMKAFFDNFVKKIRSIYADLKPESAEGQLVLEMKEQFEQLQQLFAEALADAGENYLAADGQKNSAQEGRQFSDRYPSRQITDQDQKYLDAVNRGDIEMAQKMVDDAAKVAGYDSPKLYHGTNAFGFTEFIPSMSDDRISIFATSNRQVAETYSGETSRRRISDKAKITPEELENASPEELLKLLRENISKDYRLVSEAERDQIIEANRAPLLQAARSVENLYVINMDMFDDKKKDALFAVSGALRDMAKADEYSVFMDKKMSYDDALWDLRWLDDSLTDEVIAAIGRNENLAFRELTKWLGATMFHADGEYSRINGTPWMNSTEAVNELFPRLFKGVYELYGRTGNAFEMEADGANWNQLDGSKIGQYGPVKTRDVARYAKENGHDSTIFRNIKDNGDYTYGGTSDVYVFFGSDNLKSADPVTYDDAGNVIPLSERFNPEKKDIRYSDRMKPKTFRNGQNANGEFTANALIDLADSNSEWWTGRYNHAILGMSKSDDTEFRQFYQEIHKRTKEMPEYGESEQETVASAFTVKNGKGKEFIYRVNLDGYLHGIVLEKIDKAKYEASIRSKTKGGNHGKSSSDIKRRAGNARANLGRDRTGNGRDFPSGGNSGYGGMGHGSSESNNEGTDHRRKPTDYEVPDSAELSGKQNQDRPTAPITNRTLLANALESTTQDETELTRLREYRMSIDYLNEQEAKLTELRSQIREISFGKGPRDTARLKQLQEEATKTANRINVADKKLLRLEAAKPLQRVLERERGKAYRQAQDRNKEVLARRQEGRNKTAVRHKIQRVVNELNKLLLNGDKKNHVPENMKKAVADALALVNMDTVGAEERVAKYRDLIAKETDPDKIDAYTVTMENILRKGDQMGQRLKDLRDAYEEFQKSDDPDIANAYDPVIAGSLQELAGSIGNTALKDMSMEQLQDVYDMYTMVLTRVRDSNKSLQAARNQSIAERSAGVVREIRSVGGDHKMRAAILDPVRKFFWNNLKPVYAFAIIGSVTLQEAFNAVRKGEDVWAVDVFEARKFYLEKAKKYFYNSWDFKKKYRFESESGQSFELTLGQILSLYAYSRRAQAHEHLRLGGFVFDSNIETYKEKGSKLVKYKVNTAEAHQIDPETLTEIIGTLSKDQIAFVEDMQGYLSDTMGAKGNEVTMLMYGVKLFREKNYFPLKSAKQFMFEQNEVSGEVKLKNSGFTNKLVAKANNPVILSNFMDVWAGHVNDMSMYHAFVLPLEDFNRIFNYNSPKKENIPSVSVKGTLQNAYGPASVSYVKELITDLNGGARTDSTTGIINKLMGMFKKGAVFASASVVVQQPSAVARAAAVMDLKWFVGGKIDRKRHDQLWEEVKRYAPVAVIKEMGYFDTNMGKSSLDYITGREYDGFWEKAKATITDSDFRDELLSRAPAYADEVAWCAIWDAVKRETRSKNPGMDTKSDIFLRKAGERFTEVITKTQVYDSVLARSANMRSKDTGMKMATAFMAEPTTAINMIADALLKGKRGDKKTGRKVIGSVIAAQILNAFLVSWVYAARDDDDDETYWEKYISSFVSSLIDGVNPATYIPFIKDIVSIVKGYDVERSDMAVIKDLWDAWQKLKQDDVSAWRKVEGFVGSICQIFGLPLKNIMRDVRSVWQTYNTIVNGENATSTGIKYAIAEGVTGGTISNTRQLYYARRDGDFEHAARVAARYDDADSANAAVRSAIRELYLAGEIDIQTARNHLVAYAGMEVDDAHWTIDEWKYRKEHGSDDSYGKFNDFYAAVETGDDLDAVIQVYIDNGIKKSTLSGQMTEHFKPIYLTMSDDERNAFDQKLGAAFILLGYSPEDVDDKLWSWEFEAQYGFDWADRKQAYLDGRISGPELADLLVIYGNDYDAEKATYQIEAYDWENEGFDGVTAAAIEKYNTWCEPAGVSKEHFMQIRTFSNNTENDVDNSGKTIAYSAVRKVMAEINKLPISSSQKTALAFSCGWKESTVEKYKLW